MASCNDAIDVEIADAPETGNSCEVGGTQASLVDCCKGESEDDVDLVPAPTSMMLPDPSLLASREALGERQERPESALSSPSFSLIAIQENVLEEQNQATAQASEGENDRAVQLEQIRARNRYNQMIRFCGLLLLVLAIAWIIDGAMMPHPNMP